MAQIKQTFIVRGVGVAGGTNFVTLQKLNGLAAMPDHLGLDCVMLVTTASTAPSEFWPTTTGSTPQSCVLYQFTIDRLS